MTSVATELEKHFAILVNSKPPGSQRGQVEAITNIAEAQVESESVVVSALVRYLKRAPITHKLGAIYIFDSVLRRWIEKAKVSGQVDVSDADEHGTFAAGVVRVRDVIEPLVLEVIRVCPDDQREKIKRLVMIWERSGAIPSDKLSSFKKALDPPVVEIAPERSTTPLGSPPPSVAHSHPSHPPSNQSANTPPIVPAQPVNGLQYAPQHQAAPAQTANTATSILSRLAAIAQTSSSTPPMSNPPSVGAQSAFNPPPQQPLVQAQPYQNGYYGGSTAQPVANGYAAPPPVASAPPMQQTQSQPALPINVPGFGQIPQPQAAPPAANPLAGMQPAQAAALATLMSIPGFQNTLQAPNAGAAQIPNAFAAWLQTLALGGQQPGAVPAQQPVAVPDASAAFAAFNNMQPPTAPQAEREFGRSPRRGRERSRSPNSWDRHAAQNDQNGNGRDEYRERSPAPNGISPNVEIRPKWIEFDKSMAPNHIRVLSRTLFIGGVNYTEQELHDIFAQFGEVQSCIVNKEKRHAFVKMLYRDMAARAMAEMKSSQFQHHGLRTRWGVGFGPRDCSDYNTGVSIIPISSLTDADVKWMHTAQFGGCGDMEITSGMCVEEPDIEIGAGVSSKAISRRIATDRGGASGPRSTRGDLSSGGTQRAASGSGGPAPSAAPSGPQNTPQSQAPPSAPTGPTRGGQKNGTPPTAPTGPQGFSGRGGRGHEGSARGSSGRGRGGFRERGRARRDFDTPQQFGQGFDYGANY